MMIVLFKKKYIYTKTSCLPEQGNLIIIGTIISWRRLCESDSPPQGDTVKKKVTNISIDDLF